MNLLMKILSFISKCHDESRQGGESRYACGRYVDGVVLQAARRLTVRGFVDGERKRGDSRY